MSDKPEQSARHVVLCVEQARQDVDDLVRQLTALCGGKAIVERCEGAGDAVRRVRELVRLPRQESHSFLRHLALDDTGVEQAMIEGIDRAIGPMPRDHYPAGTVLLREGEPVDLIRILESGQVQLSRQAGNREIMFYHHAAGPIVGLQSLVSRNEASFTVRALTDVVAIPLTLEQLERAVQCDEELASRFVTVIIRAHARRNEHVAELQIENEKLCAAIAADRDQLTDALSRLEQVQMQLVESEKMATLGQLSAGIAHELNNPVAAIERAVDFVGEDVIKLLGDVPDGEAIQAVMLSAMESEPVSARVTRQRREALAAAVGDDLLARRLVDIGVVTVDEYERRFGGLAPVELNRLLVVMDRYYQLGRSLRNISRCADRIASLVRSLRSYARADHQWATKVNVHEGIEDTLLMFGHALREVAVRRRYGDLPAIECYPGELNQVWTNVIANALDAMKGAGQLTIDTDAPAADHVRVRISDSGGGISPDHVGRVFDLNFTTKSGQGKFGLGMGLAICRQIAARHGGTIEIESLGGGTTVTVVLPVRFRWKPRENAES